MQVVKKWPKLFNKWPFMTHKTSGFFLTKFQRTESKKECDLYHRFRSNKGLNDLGTSK